MSSGRRRVQCGLTTEDRAAASLLSPFPAGSLAQDYGLPRMPLRGGISWVLPTAALGAFTAVNSHGYLRGVYTRVIFLLYEEKG